MSLMRWLCDGNAMVNAIDNAKYNAKNANLGLTR